MPQSSQSGKAGALDAAIAENVGQIDVIKEDFSLSMVSAGVFECRKIMADDRERS